MAQKNILVISVDIRETRVALIEDGIIAELHIERRGSSARSRAWSATSTSGR